ncbi:MAG: ATP-binding protein [Scytonema sp. PMC 1069.18]|nr:ATP-binding protein [Scytonema sp. PMC 1069.18]MEC4882423.1 ATP-binding protein [Scytonema sp. PMC 1070.18]
MDYETIHIPGSIQPHGVLLVLSTHELTIVQVSSNTHEYLGKHPQDLLGQPLSNLLDAAHFRTVQQYLQHERDGVNSFKLPILTTVGERYFDAILHCTEDRVILELEPTTCVTQTSFLNFDLLVSGAIAKMQRTSDLKQFLHLVAEEYRKITDFDRVMVYQFDHQQAGSVIAEAKREDLSSYLGLHYPATDIPEPVRQLYTRCLIRFIPDFNAQSVPLIPQPTNLTPNVDLSLSVLRSVHPCCTEYHQNMGVTAILVISLIHDQKLWGLISCHHQTPKYLPYEVRKVCECLGRIVSLELAHKVSHFELDYKVRLKSLQSEFIKSISQADNFLEAIINPEVRLLEFVNAQGAAVCLGNEITLIGATPEFEEVRDLMEWVDTQIDESLFFTDSLPKLYPAAVKFKNSASGLLVLRISKVRRYHILWFRPEVIQTVNWAGNPHESIQVDVNGNMILCPRTSFELWQEIVRFTSLPWKPYERESALDLRNAIVGVVLSKADELAKMNLELERRNQELSSFAYAASHDLKEPLRGIYNYSTVLLEDYAQAIGEDGIEYLQTLVSLSQRMEALINALLRLSQLGQAELNLQATNLNELLDQVIYVFRASRPQASLDIRVCKPLPTIQCDPVLVSEVFTNLIVNAFKYNNKTEKWVEIGFLNTQETHSSIIVYVRDNGIGIPKHHYQNIFRLFKRLYSQEKYGGGTGAGLAIAKKIVELHGGNIWVDSTVGIGSIFYFMLE